jgi:hypothetical protein
MLLRGRFQLLFGHMLKGKGVVNTMVLMLVLVLVPLLVLVLVLGLVQLL